MTLNSKTATPTELKARRERVRAATLLILIVVALIGTAAGALWLLWPYIQGSRTVAYAILGVGIAYAIFYRLKWLPEIRGRGR